jgi:menaquinone-dependent protoporphyrinogen IX oxidase
VFPVVAVTLVFGLLVSVLALTAAGGGFSGLGAIGGVIVGVLLLIGWSLRDGLLQGEPRLALSRRISLSFLVPGLMLAAALWIVGPESGWTGILIASAVFCAWLLFVAVGTAKVNREVESALVTVGRGNVGRALLVYHSAGGGLMRAMQEAFADGMQAQGWQVDLSTASLRSPVDLSGYQLLVLGTPCYNRGLSRPIAAYMNRVGDLAGVPVVIVVSGFNYTERATKTLRDRVHEAQGKVVDEIELWTARPNVARDGTTEPAEIMRRAGARLGRTAAAAAA